MSMPHSAPILANTPLISPTSALPLYPAHAPRHAPLLLSGFGAGQVLDRGTTAMLLVVTLWSLVTRHGPARDQVTVALINRGLLRCGGSGRRSAAGPERWRLLFAAAAVPPEIARRLRSGGGADDGRHLTIRHAHDACSARPESRVPGEGCGVRRSRARRCDPQSPGRSGRHGRCERRDAPRPIVTTRSGAVRSAEIHPGFTADLYSAFYPLAQVSPILRALELERHGLRWTRAPSVLAHPLRPDHAEAAVLHTDRERTAAGLSASHPADGLAWLELCRQWDDIEEPLLRSLFSAFPPVRGPVQLLTRIGSRAALRLARFLTLPAKRMGEELFSGEAARLLLTGNAVHADVPMTSPISGAFGWFTRHARPALRLPVPVGGSGELSAALARRATAAGARTVPVNAWNAPTCRTAELSRSAPRVAAPCTRGAPCSPTSRRQASTASCSPSPPCPRGYGTTWPGSPGTLRSSKSTGP